MTRAMTALFVAALAATTLATAPAAQARPTCQDAGVKTICQTNGSVSIKARPGTVAPPANIPVFPWFGMPGRRR